MSKLSKPRIGVVLSGGGSRGAFQAGVMHHLSQFKIIEDSVVVYSGVSVGALNAAGAACHGMASMRDLWKDIRSEDVYRKYGTIRSLVRLWRHGGPRSTGPLRNLLTELVDTSNLPPVPFTCGAVNIDDGQYVEFHSNSGMEQAIDYLVASASIPGVVPPVTIDGSRYWDGGLRNPTPIGQAIQYDVDYLIIIGTEPRGSHPMRPLGKANGLERIKRAISSLVEEGFESDIREFVYRNSDPEYETIPYTIICPWQDLGSADNFSDFKRRFTYGYEAANEVSEKIITDLHNLK